MNSVRKIKFCLGLCFLVLCMAHVSAAQTTCASPWNSTSVYTAGMTASLTAIPVLGVPIKSKALKGMDSLLSIAQMPGGVPVATLAKVDPIVVIDTFGFMSLIRPAEQVRRERKSIAFPHTEGQSPSTLKLDLIHRKLTRAVAGENQLLSVV